ncbi:hypothetical protein HT585_29545 [Ensifer sp. HO-A22]|uniref:Uncharacterized protein n=1 Tax=Ensifer oleiphilus TaxID=2742698 RepID=A0A7Y6QCU1_9HYPH|nr:hypothetical protein [Ensifer oleiphilus]NVD43015.1 hypothetical protein [Ensifer oleiphilus]
MTVKKSLCRLPSKLDKQGPAIRTHALEAVLELCHAYNLAVVDLHNLQVEKNPRKEAIGKLEGLCRDIEAQIMSCDERVVPDGKAEVSN